LLSELIFAARSGSRGTFSIQLLIRNSGLSAVPRFGRQPTGDSERGQRLTLSVHHFVGKRHSIWSWSSCWPSDRAGGPVQVVAIAVQ